MEKVENIGIILGKQRDSNAYIIDDILIDPGSGENINYLVESIEDSGMSMDDINKIVNTHCHFDHIGADKYLQDTYGYEICMHPLDKHTVLSKDADATVASSFGCEVPDLEIKDLNEDDMIGDFKVIHTPGHTHGGICLYDGENLISGDTLFSGGNFGRTDLPTGSIDDMKKSILKLSELDIDRLYPGHGAYAISAVREQIELTVMIASRL